MLSRAQVGGRTAFSCCPYGTTLFGYAGCFGFMGGFSAHPSDVFRLIVGQAARLAGVGIATGLAGVVLLTRVLTSLLFDVSALDPLTFGAATALLFMIAGVAAYLPARRVARIDPRPRFGWIS